MKHSITAAGKYSADKARIAIVSARFNGEIVEALCSVAHQTLLQHGVQEENIVHAHVPGAFELPLACKQYANSGYDAVMALGCVIRGETPHFDYVCRGVTNGIQQTILDTNVPIAFGVLTTDTPEQAMQRASTVHPEDNKGRDAALCVLEMIILLNSIR